VTPAKDSERDELERCRIHGPDARTVDALERALDRAKVAERDSAQVRERCQRCASEFFGSRCELCAMAEASRLLLEALRPYGGFLRRSGVRRQAASIRCLLQEYQRRYPELGP
jgi:hypothetical protein